MSGLSGINSSLAYSLYTSLTSEETSTEETTDITDIAETMEELETQLAAEGVDEETREAVQEELAQAVSDLISESGGEMPSTEDLETAFTTILTDHGLDAETLLASSSDESTSTIESLVESLLSKQMPTLFDMLSSLDEDSGSSSLMDLLGEWSELTTDYLFGFDTEA